MTTSDDAREAEMRQMTEQNFMIGVDGARDLLCLLDTARAQLSVEKARSEGIRKAIQAAHDILVNGNPDFTARDIEACRILQSALSASPEPGRDAEREVIEAAKGLGYVIREELGTTEYWDRGELLDALARLDSSRSKTATGEET